MAEHEPMDIDHGELADGEVTSISGEQTEYSDIVDMVMDDLGDVDFDHFIDIMYAAMEEPFQTYWLATVSIDIYPQTTCGC